MWVVKICLNEIFPLLTVANLHVNCLAIKLLCCVGELTIGNSPHPVLRSRSGDEERKKPMGAFTRLGAVFTTLGLSAMGRASGL